MKRGAALLCAALLGLTVALSGCSAGKETLGGAVAAKPEPKGPEEQRLTLNLGIEPAALDTTSSDAASSAVLTNVMEGLLRVGEGAELAPGAAEKWDVRGGTEYTFTLRDDARWSDGKPVTAGDFQYAWLRLLEPGRAVDSAYQLHDIKGAEEYNALAADDPDYEAKAKRLRGRVGISAPDDRTLKVTLKQPTPHWLSLTTLPAYYPLREEIVERYGHNYGAEAGNMLFNGPFTIEGWAHGERLTLKNNPGYWDAKSVKLATVDLRIITDPRIAIAMFEAGALDRTDVPGESVPTYKSDKAFSTVAEFVTWYISLNLRTPALQNVNLRRALSLAVDRTGFVANVLKNGAVPAAGLVPPSMAEAGEKSFRHLSGIHFPPDADQATARTLWASALKELNLNELELRLLVLDSQGSMRQAQGIREMVERALPGLTVQLEAVDMQRLVGRMKVGEFDLLYSAWAADYDDPLAFLETWVSTSPFNHGRWFDKQYDSLIAHARASETDAERMQAMAEAEKILATELPVVPLYHPAWNRLTKPWVKGLPDPDRAALPDLKRTYIAGRP